MAKFFLRHLDLTFRARIQLRIETDHANQAIDHANPDIGRIAGVADMCFGREIAHDHTRADPLQLFGRQALSPRTALIGLQRIACKPLEIVDPATFRHGLFRISSLQSECRSAAIVSYLQG